MIQDGTTTTGAKPFYYLQKYPLLDKQEQPLTKITELADKWRSHHSHWADTQALEWCADKLEAALPKWTKITNDPKTRPPEGVPYLFLANTKLFAKAPTLPRVSTHNTSLWEGDSWRPLCDLDYPQEQKL